MGLVSEASTLFIGNGGEVFRLGQTYFVRDLVEASVHHDPYFHCSLTSEIEAKLDLKKLDQIGIDKTLLAQKLCDLDFVYPGFSQVFVSSLNFHSWTLIDETLGQLPDDGPLLNLKFGARKQLANRTLFNIRIQAQIWQQLNPENKIALIFHEVIFSLLKFSCDDLECTTNTQSARVAREITGLLFSKATYFNNDSRLKLQTIMLLSFNSNIVDIKDWLKPKIVRFTGYNKDGILLFKSEMPSTVSVAEFVDHLCGEYSELSGATGLSVMIIDTKNFSLSSVFYNTRYGKESGIKISQSKNIRSILIRSIRDNLDCSNKVKKAVATY